MNKFISEILYMNESNVWSYKHTNETTVIEHGIAYTYNECLEVFTDNAIIIILVDGINATIWYVKKNVRIKYKCKETEIVDIYHKLIKDIM